MSSSLISLGSNLGNVRESMNAAKRMLSEIYGPTNLRFSQLYRTPPVGGPSGQKEFLNAAVSIQSQSSAWEIWETIKHIELSLGRQRQLRWESRRIDIDLLLHNRQRIWTPHLKVPHPRMCMRSFILKPACEIASDWIDPVTEWSLSDLWKHLEWCRTSDSYLRVICEDQRHGRRLMEAFRQSDPGGEVSVQWEVLEIGNPRTVIHNEDGRGLKLSIFAVATPDPMNVLWEDYSLPWARWLNLSGDGTIAPAVGPLVQGPRYLMPSNDLDWTLHEIRAASEAMQSWIEVSEPFEP